MQIEERLKFVEKALEDRKVRDTKVLDVRGKSNVTDYMVITSASSNRQVKAVAENVMHDVKQAGWEILGAEGLNGSDWALVDLGDIVIHIMMEPTRALYDLERLWGEDVFEEEKA